MAMQGFNFERPTGSVEKNNFYTPSTSSRDTISREIMYNSFYRDIKDEDLVSKKSSKKPKDDQNTK